MWFTSCLASDFSDNCTYDLCLTGAAPAHGTGIEGLEALEAFQEFLLFSIYIYIYIDGCWCLLMLIDVWTFWMMLIPFFDLWINLYHRSIFSRIVAFSMDKEQRRQNHSGPCMCPPWQCFRCPGNPGAPLETERLLKPGWWVVRAY